MFKNKKFYLDGAMGSEIIKRGFNYENNGCYSKL